MLFERSLIAPKLTDVNQAGLENILSEGVL